MVDDKKKRKKLKNAIKQKTKVKQIAKQSTNINIRIGDGKKKRKKRAKKKGGLPPRLQRRPHLPTNPLIGSLMYNPPPGYLTPYDIRNALPPPPPQPVPVPVPVPAAVAPPLPVAVGQAAGVVAQGQPVQVGAAVQAGQPQGEDVAPLRQPAPPLQRGRPRVQFAPAPQFQPVQPPHLSPRSQASPGSYAGSIGTSGGGASPRRVLRNPIAGNVMPSEAQISRQQQVAQRGREDTRVGLGLSLPYGSPLGPSPDMYGSGGSERDEDEAKSGGGGGAYASSTALMAPQNRLRQGNRGILTGGATGPGGGNGLMAPGGTFLGAGGDHPPPSYVNTYADNPVNRAKGRVGQPHKSKAGGARKGAGRPKGGKVYPADNPQDMAEMAGGIGGGAGMLSSRAFRPVADASQALRPKPVRRRGLKLKKKWNSKSTEI